jgi:hypothetical protein
MYIKVTDYNLLKWPYRVMIISGKHVNLRDIDGNDLTGENSGAIFAAVQQNNNI